MHEEVTFSRLMVTPQATHDPETFIYLLTQFSNFRIPQAPSTHTPISLPTTSPRIPSTLPIVPG